jgi:choline dehydrogenase
MLFRQLVSAAAFASLAKAIELTGYEYVVVGSGAGKMQSLTQGNLKG